MTEPAYNEHPGLRATVLKACAKSPKHAHHTATTHIEPTDAMRWGGLVDWCLLDPEEFWRNARIAEVSSKRVKAWKEHVEEYGEQWSITGEEAGRLGAMQTAFINNENAMRYARGGEPHYACFWEDEMLGKCKAEIDYLNSAMHRIVELKTCAEIGVHQFMSQAERMGYLIQLGFYHHGIEITTGEQWDVTLIAMESKPPHDIVVYDVQRAMLEQGYAEAEQLARRYRASETAGMWRGVASEIQPWERPAWVGSNETVSLKIGGSKVEV